MREGLKRNGVWILAGVFVVAIVRTTAANGLDFEVYWNAARAWMEGLSPYSVDRAGYMVFKYPPWLLPLFLPFAALPLALAKVVWGLVEAGSLLYATQWLLGQGLSHVAVAVGLVAFAGLWTVHAFLGQISLPLLAVALLVFPRPGPLRSMIFFWAFSSKVFTLFAALGLRKDLVRPRVWLMTALLFAGLSLPVLLVTEGKSPLQLAEDWKVAMASGGKETATGRLETASRDAQGFPSAIIRARGVGHSDVLAFAGIALAVSALLAAGWFMLSRSLPAEEQWVGWLGLTAAIQPLGWFHFFVLAFPLAVFALDRALDPRLGGRRAPVLTLAILGIALVAVVTEKTLGRVGYLLELASVKSWGVVSCAAVLLLCHRWRKNAY